MTNFEFGQYSSEENRCREDAINMFRVRTTVIELVMLAATVVIHFMLKNLICSLVFSERIRYNVVVRPSNVSLSSLCNVRARGVYTIGQWCEMHHGKFFLEGGICDDNDAFARVYNNLLLYEYIYYFTPVNF